METVESNCVKKTMQNILRLTVSCVTVLALPLSFGATELKREDFRAHDPFILADNQSHTYYLYTSITNGALPNNQAGVVTYASKDLMSWQGPEIVFKVPQDIWADPVGGAWAPEVHCLNGKYYLFVTLHNKDKPLGGLDKSHRPRHMRSTQIFVSGSPKGPFEPMTKSPTLPADMMTLDGTLFIEDSVPWMVYCHEWIQITDGTIEAIRLTEDLSKTVGKPKVLFQASVAPWVGCIATDPDAYVTDGPFLCRTKTGTLLMLWSSWQNNGKYAQGLAVSQSGRLEGPWIQKEPLLTDDSGHGMIFQTFDGQLILVVHRPTMSPKSRARLHKLEDTGGGVRINPPSTVWLGIDQ